MKSSPSPSQNSRNTANLFENQPDDQSWQDFLQNHQPIAPPAHPDLEDWILHEIHTLQRTPQSNPRWRRWFAWGIVGTIACGSLAIWGNTQRQLQIAESSHQTDLAQLQYFIEQSYDGVYISTDDALN